MKALDLTCTVEEFVWLTPTVFQISFSTEPKIQFIAGQFFSVVIPGAGPQGRDLRRAYSIASSPEQPLLQLCVRKVEGGPGTTYLSSLKVGQTFKGQATFGHFVYKSAASKDVYFISTGTGISPFRSILNSKAFLANPPKSITCLFGSTDEKEIIYQKDVFKTPGLNFTIALSRSSPSWNGFKGRVTHFISSIENKINWDNSDFYLCGNGLMIDEVKKMLTEKGVKKESIFQEVYYKPKDQK